LDGISFAFEQQWFLTELRRFNFEALKTMIGDIEIGLSEESSFGY
jgi:hypothetical protein